MLDLTLLEKKLSNCPCGRVHKSGFRNMEIGPGLADRAGEILSDAGFPGRLHLVADKNTLAASEGLLDALGGFYVTQTVFEDLRSADEFGVARVREDMDLVGAQAVLSVGTGSLNDICRYAAFESGRLLAIFATAPSMDGFASVNAPITFNGFKRTFPSKAPEVLIADTKILARSPAELKAAGLGDLLGKYTAHADWEVASAVTGEYYCDAVAGLTRSAVDRAVALTGEDSGSEAFSASLMEALVLSGIAMKLCECTRPASGAEHHIAHFWEMKYQQAGKEELFHGKKVGISCAMVADVYGELSELKSVKEVRRELDREALSAVFGPLWREAERENDPNPLDSVPFGIVEEKWEQIRACLARVPSGEEIRGHLRAAGGAATCAEAGISEELERQGLIYGKYARFRMTMMRLLDGISYTPDYERFMCAR